MDNALRLDATFFCQELSLLLSILKTEKGENSFLNQKEWPGDMNWGTFLQLARHHRVFPLVYRKLCTMEETAVPQCVIQTLRHDYQKHTFQMLALSAEMAQLCKMFSASGIRTLNLKGPVLAADLYGDLSLRTSRDLDVLIPIHKLDRAEELLGSIGYVKVEYPDTILNDWKWRHHHVTFFHPDKQITVEVHWRLSPGPGKEPPFNDLWERKRVSTITSNPVYYLGREDLFLFLVSHGARHGWSRLRWLVDIDRITRQNLDCAKLNLLLNRNSCRHIGAQALILASQLLHTPLTEEMKSITAAKRAGLLANEALFYIRQMVNLHTIPVPEDVSNYHKRHLFSLMSVRHKVLFILSFLYPYPEDTRIVRLPKQLHFLYFPLRPVLWAWRKTRRHALS
jgi:hypothetical protein